MAEISASVVMALREKTGLPLMEVKKALQQAGGDEGKAVDILRSQSGKVIEKRAANPTEEGRIFVALKDDNSQAAMVELQCESEPVSKSNEFNALGNSLVSHLLSGPGARSVDELLCQSAPGQKKTLKEMYEDAVNKIREKLVVARIARVSGPVASYVHHDYKTAVLFQAEGKDGKLPVLREVAMHIAALKPDVANISDLDPIVVKKARDRLVEEARKSGKPENIIEKIVDGQMKKFYRDEAGVLVEQPFAKDETKSVSQVLAEKGLKAKAFTLWVLGT